MTDIDRILDLCDQATQHAGDIAYPFGDSDMTRCWRCLAADGHGAANLCDDCRTELLDETYRVPSVFDYETAAPVSVRILTADEVAALAPLQARAEAASAALGHLGGTVRQVGEACRNVTQQLREFYAATFNQEET